MSKNEDQEKMLKALDMVLINSMDVMEEKITVLNFIRSVMDGDSLGDKDADKLMRIIAKLGNLAAATSMGFKKWGPGFFIPYKWVDIILGTGEIVYGCVTDDYGRVVKRSRNSDATLCAKDDLWIRESCI